METYTKEQLIQGMTAYNQHFIDDPDFFTDVENATAEDRAKNQVEYLLSLIK